MTCLLAILAYLPVDAVSYFADGVVVHTTERVLVGGAFHENGDGRIHAAGHTVGRRKERVVAGGGGTERVRTRIAVWIVRSCVSSTTPTIVSLVWKLGA